MYVSKPKTELSVWDLSSTRDRILNMAKQILLKKEIVDFFSTFIITTNTNLFPIPYTKDSRHSY